MIGFGPQTGLRCPALTKKGTPCPIDAEESRNGWCHVHDPNGKMKLSSKSKEIKVLKKKQIMAMTIENNLRELIAKDIEAQCPVLIECDCSYHYAASIARGQYV